MLLSLPGDGANERPAAKICAGNHVLFIVQADQFFLRTLSVMMEPGGNSQMILSKVSWEPRG